MSDAADFREYEVRVLCDCGEERYAYTEDAFLWPDELTEWATSHEHSESDSGEV